MAEKVLGIDLGSSCIKVVQVSRNIRKTQVLGYASVGLPADAEPSQIGAILKNLLLEHNLESDRYVVAVSTQAAFLRRLSFPFTSQRKIDQVIQFELEPSLPLGIDETQVDFVKTDRASDGRQFVLAAIVPRRFLDPLLGGFHEIGIVPAAVDLDGSALTSVAEELRERIPERAIVLDIGHSKTNLLYWRRRQGHCLRALAFGCSRLAKAVSGDLGLTPEEGLKRALSVGLDGPTRTPDDEQTRKALATEVHLLGREIELTIMAFQPQERQAGPEQALLCGGGALIGGLAPALEKELGFPVRLLADMEDVGILNHFGTDPRFWHNLLYLPG